MDTEICSCGTDNQDAILLFDQARSLLQPVASLFLMYYTQVPSAHNHWTCRYIFCMCMCKCVFVWCTLCTCVSQTCGTVAEGANISSWGGRPPSSFNMKYWLTCLLRILSNLIQQEADYCWCMISIATVLICYYHSYGQVNDVAKFGHWLGVK